MKRLLLLFTSLTLFSTAFAQDPDLFRTWYLYELQSSDLSTLYIVNDIEPSIQPFITIQPNLAFDGEGACNTFSGTYAFEPGELTSMDLTSSMDDCGISIHNNFENSYFDFMQFIWFEISPDGNGLTLNLSNAIFGYAILKDYELSVNDYTSNSEIKLYPNPSSETINISSEGTAIESLAVYTLAGQLLISQTVNDRSIDVSSLSEGIYLLEIISEFGRQYQKFIKD